MEDWTTEGRLIVFRWAKTVETGVNGMAISQKIARLKWNSEGEMKI